MKKLSIILFLVFAYQIAATAQNAVTLKTKKINGGLTIILATYDNILKLFKADSVQMLTIIKKYNYETHEGGWCYPKNTLDYSFGKPESSMLWMKFAGTEYDVNAFDSSILKLNPEVKIKKTSSVGGIYNSYITKNSKNGLSEYLFGLNSSGTGNYILSISKF